MALPTAPLVHIPESLLVSCSPLPIPSGGGLDILLANHVAVTGAYHECATRHDGLADAVRAQLRDASKMADDARQ